MESTKKLRVRSRACFLAWASPKSNRNLNMFDTSSSSACDNEFALVCKAISVLRFMARPNERAGPEETVSSKSSRARKTHLQASSKEQIKSTYLSFSSLSGNLDAISESVRQAERRSLLTKESLSTRAHSFHT